MCEFCGCATRSVQNVREKEATGERKPVNVHIVATTAVVKGDTDALERREQTRSAETAAA